MSTNVNELISELKGLDLPATISGSYLPIVDLVNLIRCMIEDGGDYEATSETLIAVRDNELSSGGRMGLVASQYGSLLNESAVDNQGKFDLELGKALMYLQVRSRNGARINWAQSLVRNLTKIFWFPIIFDWALGRVFGANDRLFGAITKSVVMNEFE